MAVTTWLGAGKENTLKPNFWYSWMSSEEGVSSPSLRMLPTAQRRFSGGTWGGRAGMLCWAKEGGPQTSCPLGSVPAWAWQNHQFQEAMQLQIPGQRELLYCWDLSAAPACGILL